MLVIRLQRVGKKNKASFRIVLQDKKWQPQGKALELLGHYDPHSKDRKVQEERIKYWISKGAQLSPTLHNMFIDMKVIEGPKVQARKLIKKDSTKGGEPAPTTSLEEEKEEEKKEEVVAEAV